MPIVLGVMALLGFGASSVLAADYVRQAAVFCGEGSGCDLVRASQYAEILGIKTPFLGVFFFAVVLVLAIWPARRALVVWAAGGALASLAFLAIQAFVLHTFCKFCVVADVSALAVFGLAVATRKLQGAPKLRTAVSVGAVAAGLGLAPLAVPAPPPPPPAVAEAPVPDVIASLQQPGVATIVEFDFECPFCRRLHATMEDVKESYGDKIRIIRKQLPLTGLHEHAMDAALAACCAEEVGAGDAMADALFRAPPSELTPEGCERIARSVAIDLEAYRACMASDRPRKRVEADLAEARAAGLAQSVPQFFVGGKLFKGVARPEVIRAAIDAELAGP